MNISCDETSPMLIDYPDIIKFGLKQVEVQVGQRIVRLKNFNGTPIKNKLVQINKKYAKLLLLPVHCQLRYKIKNKNPLRLQLGPVVGILTTVNYNPVSGLPRGKEAYYFAELITYAHRLGIFIYLFYPSDVNWNNNTIKGYTLDTKRKFPKWEEGLYPIPDIVYNRIRSRSIENKPNVLKLLNKFESKGITLFNSRFLDKWVVYNALQSNPFLVQTLPPTAIFSYDNLKDYLAKYSEVFIKPRNSSIGKGIIKVVKHSDKYMFAQARSNKINWQPCSSFDQLYNAVTTIVVHSSRYIIQMGIDLAKVDNKIFDLRVLVQKDKEGQWILSGTGVRAAAPEHFVTHIPNGGSARPYEDVVQQVFSYSTAAKKIFNEQLKVIATEAPQTLERITGLLLAILSVDIGIDREGKMWIIEMNSKPSSFDETIIRDNYLKHFNDYCIHIFSL
ncbi:MAG TPA: YheC/YheD family protein [Syntrophomonadaceae bacterium]|nr:YheC/YheD family protein [Syntrophomonadaceae bacterium]